MSKEAQETAARLRKAHAKKTTSIPILIMESNLYDWNPGRQMTLMVIALGTRTNPNAWIQEDAPLTAEQALGWCDMSQWRIALRAKKSESAVQKDIRQFEKDGVLEVKHWEDDNLTKHALYRINADVLRENARPAQKKNVERPKRYKKSSPSRGRFTAENQPRRGKNKNAGVYEMDEEVA
jgi:hypothetical protein